MTVCKILLQNSYKSGLHDYSMLYGDNQTLLLFSELKKNQWYLLLMFFFNGRRLMNYSLSKLETFKTKKLHIIDNPIYSYFFIKRILKKEFEIIYTIHDFHPHVESRFIFKIRTKLAYYLNLKILKLSQKNKMLKVHFHQKISETYDKYDYVVFQHPLYNHNYTSYFQCSAKNAGKLTLGFFGRLTYGKGFDIFVEIISLVSEMDINEKINFIVAGQGKIPNNEILNLSNVKVYNKFIETNDFDKLISEVDFLVLPYRDITQSGILIKAISMLKPIISSKIVSDNQLDISNIGFFSNNNNSKEYIGIIENILASKINSNLFYEDLLKVKQSLVFNKIKLYDYFEK